MWLKILIDRLRHRLEEPYALSSVPRRDAQQIKFTQTSLPLWTPVSGPEQGWRPSAYTFSPHRVPIAELAYIFIMVRCSSRP